MTEAYRRTWRALGDALAGVVVERDESTDPERQLELDRRADDLVRRMDAIPRGAT